MPLWATTVIATKSLYRFDRRNSLFIPDYPFLFRHETPRMEDTLEKGA
jgi:hypothetical protein